MKVAIDCRMLTKSGIGVYLENILRYLLDNKNYNFLLIGSEKYLLKYTNNSRCEFQYTDIEVFAISEILFFNCEHINKCTVYYSPNFNFPAGLKIPVLLSIHDLVFLEIPKFTSVLGRFIRWFYVKRAFEKADVIFTVSKFSRERIRSILGVEKIIDITYNGLNNALLAFDRSCVKPIFMFDYFLYVGNIKPHKGLSLLLDAYHLVRQSGDSRKLVIIGDYKTFKTKDKHITKQINGDPDIVFTGKIKDEDLYMIMSSASMLIQPSLYEGFGIPPLEALYLGTPVLLSDIPVFRELYASFSVDFFDLSSPDKLAKLMLSREKKNFLNFSLPVEFDYRYAANVISNRIDSYENFTNR